MAERLYIRDQHDLPHGRHEAFPDSSVCGASLRNAHEITDAQAVKFLNNARCPDCFPGWSVSRGRVKR